MVHPGRDLVIPLDVTLEEVYTGATRQVKVNQKLLHRSGRKTSQDVFEVHIEKGAPDGHRITFPGAAGASPGEGPGNVCFVLQERRHPRWRRQGLDLFLEHRLTLIEALTGYRVVFRHLDGRKLLVCSRPGELVWPRSVLPSAEAEWGRFEHTDAFPGEDACSLRTGDLEACKELCRRRGYGGFTYWEDRAYFRARDREDLLAARKRSRGSTLFVGPDPAKSAALCTHPAIRGAGMPCLGKPEVRGNLFLLLRVDFPAEVDESAAALLREALPPCPVSPAPAPEELEGLEELRFCDLDPSESQRRHYLATGGVGAPDRAAEAEDEAPPVGSPGPPPCRQM